MQFLLIGYDGSDVEASERRKKARPAHLLLAQELKLQGKLLYATALTSEEPGQEDVLVGSVMVYDFPTRQDLDLMLTGEPYLLQKVWQKTEVRKCKAPPLFQAHFQAALK